jgi:hypothetical protein
MTGYFRAILAAIFWLWPGGHPLNRACGDPPSKFAGQDSAPTFTCLRLPVDVQPVLARADEVIE